MWRSWREAFIESISYMCWTYRRPGVTLDGTG